MHSGLIAAYILLPITITIIVTLISIAVMFRFKCFMKRSEFDRSVLIISMVKTIDLPCRSISHTLEVQRGPATQHEVLLVIIIVTCMHAYSVYRDMSGPLVHMLNSTIIQLYVCVSL